MYGGPNCYKLHWESYHGTARKGFVHVCLATEKPTHIIPIHVKNCEEMKFNIFTTLFYFLQLNVLWNSFYEFVEQNLPKFISDALMLFSMLVWFYSGYFGIPIPVKATLVIGDPIPVNPGDDVDAIHIQCKENLNNLVKQCQGESYPTTDHWGKLKERWFNDTIIEEVKTD